MSLLDKTPIPYATSRNFSISVHISSEEIQKWVEGYASDDYFSKVINTLRNEEDLLNPRYPQFFLGENGLLYFEDWEGNMRLCVPHSLWNQIMRDDHEIVTKGAHSGYYKAFNRLASTFFWPQMSKDIKAFVLSCDIHQKNKPKQDALYGLLCPIPSHPNHLKSLLWTLSMNCQKLRFVSITFL